MTRQAEHILAALTLAAMVVNSPVIAKEVELNEPPKGFSALFTGKDFAGWRMSEKNAEHWKVVDGVMVYDGKGGSLPTEKDYGDFELHVD